MHSFTAAYPGLMDAGAQHPFTGVVVLVVVVAWIWEYAFVQSLHLQKKWDIKKRVICNVYFTDKLFTEIKWD